MRILHVTGMERFWASTDTKACCVCVRVLLQSVWFAQSKEPKDDSIALVQPSSERLPQIRQFGKDAGSRLLLLVNPQWKERDDPLDALSRKGGVLGALGARHRRRLPTRAPPRG